MIWKTKTWRKGKSNSSPSPLPSGVVAANALCSCYKLRYTLRLSLETREASPSILSQESDFASDITQRQVRTRRL